MLRPSSSSEKDTPPLQDIQFEKNKKKNQEQIDIFYNTGRRIHKVTSETLHLKKFRNKPREGDTPQWNHCVKYGNNSDRCGQPWRIEMLRGIKSNRHIMSHNDPNIEPGYKGIMDLDLTDIPHKFRKQAIDQHHKDIHEYKEEQAKRPERSRYEYTVERSEHIHHIDAIAADKRRRDAAEAQRLRDERFTIGRRKFITQQTSLMDDDISLSDNHNK